MTLPQRVRIAERLVRRLTWEDVDRASIRRLVEEARKESVSGSMPRPGSLSQQRTVDLVAQGETTVCGLPLVPMIASAFDLRNHAHVLLNDSTVVIGKSVLASLSGSMQPLDPAVGVLCAFLQRLSGIATHAHLHARVLGSGRTRLLDCGDFTPGWRALEKYALGCGGAWDGGGGDERVRIDSNERVSRPSFEPVVRHARRSAPDAAIEVIVRKPAALGAAVAVSPDVILLEGFAVPEIRRAVGFVSGRTFVAAHGGITLANIGEYAGLGLDFVSVDGLVSGARWAPIGANWRE